MSAPDEAPMSDIAYAVFWCKRPIEEVAAHAGTTTTRILEELKRNPPPKHLLPSGR